MLATAGAAHADEAYHLPAVGAELTYRLISTPGPGSPGVTYGQVYTYIVGTAGDATIEGTIKPVAMIYGCPSGSSVTACQQAAANPAAQRDGDLVTVPVPGDIGDALAKESSFKISYFLVGLRKFAVPAATHVDDPKDTSFGAEPAFVLTNELKCDFTKLADFLPFGKTTHLSLPCHNLFERTASRTGLPDVHADDPISLELSYDGTAHRSLPSGDWEVHKIVNKIVREGSPDPVGEADLEIATRLGVTVRTHTTVTGASTGYVTDTVSELIAYKP